MFISTYHHKIDKKGRMSIPHDWIEKLGSNVCIYGEDDQFLIGMSLDLDQATRGIKDALDLQTDYHKPDVYFADMYKCPISSDGRIVLPLGVKSKNATLKGSGSYFMIQLND